ncbi:MAG: hypothetical protein Q9160_007721 [Pyrenula sp. 1 TL-2023]
MGRVRRNWTPEEDALLRRVVNNALTHSRPLLWRELAKSVPGRSNKDCRRRWWNSLADGTAKGPWAEEEDERLIEAVKRLGTNWSQVARAVGSRNSDQCSSHWSQVLDPDINFCDWTIQEDEHLLHAVLTHGTNWTTIASSHSPRRTTLALKNRYYTLRLRHENSTKSKDRTTGKTVRNSTPSSESSRSNSEKESQMYQKLQGRHTPKENDHFGERENDDDDDGEDEEDQDAGEGNADQSNSEAQVSHFQSMTKPSKVLTSAMESNTTDPTIATSAAWTGFSEQTGLLSPESFHHGTSPLSNENWMNETADQTSYENPFALNQASLFLEHTEDVLGTIPDPGGIGAKAPQTLYGEDPMEMFLPPSPGYLSLSKPASAPQIDSTLETAEITPPIAFTNMCTNSTVHGDPSATYEVAINMVCTGSQLKGIMGGLAGAGTCVNMKIEPKL